MLQQSLRITFLGKRTQHLCERFQLSTGHVLENNHLHFPTESAAAAQIKALRALGHPVWDEFFAMAPVA